jgi:hypothetical protein
MHRQPIRTEVAIQADEFAAALNSGLKLIHLVPGDYVPELIAPAGPSTAGGRLATQRLRLVPRQPGFPIVVVGSANHVDGTAEIRSFDYVDAVHRARFRQPFPISRDDYTQFVDDIVRLFEIAKLSPEVREPPPEGVALTASLFAEVNGDDSSRTSRSAVVGLLAVAVVAAFAAIVAAAASGRRSRNVVGIERDAGAPARYPTAPAPVGR